MRTPEVSGTVVGRFRLESRVGEGAMGNVYRAFDEERGERVALKLLLPELAQDERFRRRFLRETELAGHLEHPHIVRTLASGQTDGTLYLAMAYVEGSDLRGLLRREGRFERERAFLIAAQVADALDAAHDAGLVHRDVKPGNILVAGVAPEERAYVCDFGLARHVSSVSSLTGDRGFVGTIDYVPPEQIEGRTLDRRADVYSLGCVLYECLTGERPFDRESELAVVFAHLNERPPPVTQARPELPEALDGVFATALAKAPEHRYATCGELVAAARAAGRGERFKVLKRPRRRLFAGSAAAIVGAAVASGAALVLTRHTSASPSAASASPAAITQHAIKSARVGLGADAYESHFGPWVAGTLELYTGTNEPGSELPKLAFQVPKVAVYFPPKGKRAMAITTWNRHNKTAAGVGPCSTVATLKRAYGRDLRPSEHGRAGGRQWSYVVGRNILFAVNPERQIVSAVILFDGGAPRARKRGGTESFANFIGASETPCA